MPDDGLAFLQRFFVLVILLFSAGNTFGRIKTDSIYSFSMGTDVKITMDVPQLKKSKKGILVIYALPNGNTTEETMGKKMKEGDDWHFDIQHIRAQTKFVRKQLSDDNIIVAYLENSFKSWPAWKTKHEDYITVTQRIVDTLFKLIPLKKKIIYLDSHSGGGRFIFDYLDGVNITPSNGFIHSILAGTKYDSKGYRYFGKRAYENLIEE